MDSELLGPEPDSGPIYISGGPAELVWEVPPDTSVVVLTIDGESRWQRPIGGVSLFDTDLRGGEPMELVAFDVRGDVVTSHRLTAR